MSGVVVASIHHQPHVAVIMISSRGMRVAIHPSSPFKVCFPGDHSVYTYHVSRVSYSLPRPAVSSLGSSDERANGNDVGRALGLKCTMNELGIASPAFLV